MFLLFKILLFGVKVQDIDTSQRFEILFCNIFTSGRPAWKPQYQNTIQKNKAKTQFSFLPEDVKIFGWDISDELIKDVSPMAAS